LAGRAVPGVEVPARAAAVAAVAAPVALVPAVVDPRTILRVPAPVVQAAWMVLGAVPEVPAGSEVLHSRVESCRPFFGRA
jgi:hypothetical protein